MYTISQLWQELVAVSGMYQTNIAYILLTTFYRLLTGRSRNIFIFRIIWNYTIKVKMYTEYLMVVNHIVYIIHKKMSPLMYS